MTARPRAFSSLLIANRGEIACRIMRTARAMGLRTIAVYSGADAQAPHVKMADEAHLIGPAPARESYLNIERVLEAARDAGAEAVHPGYGFLSENAAFARACIDAGLVFIGPGAEAIELMGDKAKAKRRMIAAGVACVPGYEGEDQSDAAFLAAAKKIGFPVMVKAAGGGGGRGMRRGEAEKDLGGALKTARSEAQNAFGGGGLILERAIEAPRHVEIQILADHHGSVVHLGERDCSVQRRHQKVIEEAPSPALAPDLRAAMGAAAVKAARDIAYVGAGTVEFLLDKGGAFYFLEMNTRLQVEHPVTEMITGLDIVALQIRVARGEPLGFEQADVEFKGHAIEARLYAEDVAAGFLPAAGTIDFWRAPAGDGVRVDAGVEFGSEVSAFYDPMLAKIIAHGATREDARRKLLGALEGAALFGAPTNRRFLIDALKKPAFVSGEATTAFIAQSFTEAELATPFSAEDAAVGAALMFQLARGDAHSRSVSCAQPLLNWSSAGKIATPYQLQRGDDCWTIRLSPEGLSRYRVASGGDVFAVDIVEMSAPDAIIALNGERVAVVFNRPDRGDPASRLQISIDGRDFDLRNLHAARNAAEEAAGAGAVTAPMHGLLVDIFAKPGDRVVRGDPLAVLEAMKMQHQLTAAIDGEIVAVHVAAGAQVAANALLMEIAPGAGVGAAKNA